MRFWFCLIAFIIVLFMFCMTMAFGQAPDPNIPTVKQAAPPGDPSLPRLVRQTLAGQILSTSADWMIYYDVAPRDTVQVYYNLNVFLNVLRLQELQIKQLTERVAVLEKKLVIDPNAPIVVK